jgi:hypothetical protein
MCDRIVRRARRIGQPGRVHSTGYNVCMPATQKLDDPERVRRVLDALRAGNTVVCSAALAGVGVSTHNRRVADDPDYAAAVEEARAEAEARMVAVVVGSAHDGNVDSAKWFLSRSRGWTEKREADVHVSGVPALVALGRLEDAMGLGDGSIPEYPGS